MILKLVTIHGGAGSLAAPFHAPGSDQASTPIMPVQTAAIASNKKQEEDNMYWSETSMQGEPMKIPICYSPCSGHLVYD